MPKYGFAIDPTGNAVCASKDWPEQNCSAGYLLFVYGTVPDPISVCPDSHQKCLRKAESVIQQILEQMSTKENNMDFTLIATSIRNGLQRVNQQIRAISKYLGHGIYIGGTILFFRNERYLVMPFGGGDVCIWSEQAKQISHIGDPVMNTYITQNPLGNKELWTCKYWTDILRQGNRLLISSVPFRNTPQICNSIITGTQPGFGKDAAANLLQQELEKYDLTPVAVMDIHY